MGFKFSKHARFEIRKRKIPMSLIRRVLKNPDQKFPEKIWTKKVYQSKLELNDGKTYLLRVIVNESVKPFIVVTVYLTSKLKKYWKVINENSL